MSQQQIDENDKQTQIDEKDWDITPDGLYIATRGFLTRRGYCCANKCRNCPYINWRSNPEWQPVPHSYVRRIRVSAKAFAGVQEMLRYHQEQAQLCEANKEQVAPHRAMIEHYQFLLKQWS